MSVNSKPEPTRGDLSPDLTARVLAHVAHANLTDIPAAIAERDALLEHVERACGRLAAMLSPRAGQALAEARPVDAPSVAEDFRHFDALLDEAYPLTDQSIRAAAFTVEWDQVMGESPRRRVVERDQVVAGWEIGAASCGECGELLEWIGDDRAGDTFAQCCNVVYEARPVALAIVRREIPEGRRSYAQTVGADELRRERRRADGAAREACAVMIETVGGLLRSAEHDAATRSALEMLRGVAEAGLRGGVR